MSVSNAALALLRRRIAGEWVPVTEDTRPSYQELVEAGMMETLHSFARGSSGAYRLTEAAITYAQSNLLPCDEAAPSRRS
jgi:hypothetical protein